VEEPEETEEELAEAEVAKAQLRVLLPFSSFWTCGMLESLAT
jgi:hypothetical protein